MRRVAAVLAFVLLATGCAKPLPPERQSYVGDWRDDSMRLNITADGFVSYKRRSGSNTSTNTSTIDAPIKEFRGDNFVVGIGPLSTTFVVSEAPHLSGDAWVMVVDGVKLQRVDKSRGN